MGVFIRYSNFGFSNLADSPQTIITANPNTVAVNRIIICNRGEQPILMNLQQYKNQTSPITTYLANRFYIEGWGSADLLDAIRSKSTYPTDAPDAPFFLEYTTSPSTISDSLIVFSSGYSQKYDCTVYFTVITGN